MAEKKYKNGARYVGDVNGDGERHGQGTYYYANGANYRGGWRYGKKNGTGTMTSADGDVKSGEWSNDSYVGSKSSVKTAKTSTTNTKTKSMTNKKSGILGNLGLELGKYNGDQLAYSPVGVAVKKKDGEYVVYNKQQKQLISIGELKMDVPFYMVPVLYENIQEGDLLKLDGTFYTVEAKTENKGLKLITPTTGSYAYKPSRTTLFGMYFYTKVVSLLDSVGGGFAGLTGGAAGADAAAGANPFGGNFNPLLLMMMNKDGGNGGFDMSQMLLLSTLGGGGVQGLNPLMLMAMSGSGESDDLMQLLLMSQVAGTGANPLANLFGGAAQAAPAATPAAGNAPAAN